MAEGLDLSGVRDLVNEWIVDQIVVTRDNGAADDALDEVTGDVTEAPDSTVYDGRGAVQPLSGFVEEADPDVARIISETGADYRLLIPLDTDVVFRFGDAVKVTVQRSFTIDPMLTRRNFDVVYRGPVSSFAAVRIVYLKER